MIISAPCSPMGLAYKIGPNTTCLLIGGAVVLPSGNVVQRTATTQLTFSVNCLEDLIHDLSALGFNIPEVALADFIDGVRPNEKGEVTFHIQKEEWELIAWDEVRGSIIDKLPVGETSFIKVI